VAITTHIMQIDTEVFDDAQHYDFYMNERTADAQDVVAQRLWMTCFLADQGEPPHYAVGIPRTTKPKTSKNRKGSKSRKKTYERTPFEAASREQLVAVYSTCPFPTVDYMASLALGMGVTEKKVREWFCNRRKRYPTRE
jgi:hypothetical protein